ncbi:DNA gyrase subunit A [Zavarzinia aquatilis]|nr:DNA gyrase subunit A [Zavarzinia aquatilis]
MPPRHDIAPISIEDEMRRSYLDYAMSVIVSRALPDARDGLKPVHRRILHAMNESGYDWNKSYRKSARIVGEVIGKYHPHGDSAVYMAMVRLVQPFSMRLPLLDGQGNFGSMDGDMPAAMRYTEIRMGKPAHALLEDIEKETVDFQPNYDGSEREPIVLPARFPNLLVNGAGGIAVGMATNIPPHNLGDVIDACLAYMDNPHVPIERLIEIVQAPDFPTGGLIIGGGGARQAYLTGRGSVLMRARTHVEEIRKDRFAIVATEIPYQVNKATLLEKIGDEMRSKRIEGIAELRDESDREGVRVVVELKRDAIADVVLNQLFKHTPLQQSFGIQMLAIDHGRPQTMTLKQLIAAFVEFREEVITRRSRFELTKARDRAHILAGLAIAVANIDEVIRVIRTSPDPAAAREALMSRDWPVGDVDALLRLVEETGHPGAVDGTYRLSEVQARAILDLRLQRLTALGRDEIEDELKQLGERITYLLSILRSREVLFGVMRDELLAVRGEFANPRRTEVVAFTGDLEDEDLIAREDMVVTVSHTGYIKRVPLTAYRAQRRGGKGKTGMATRDEDFVSRVFVANTHTPVLFFSSRGIAYQLKVWRLPEGLPQSRGKALINILPLEPGERIAAVMPMPEDEESWDKLHVVFATKKGNIRRNALSDFVDVRSNGKIAMKFEGEDADDELIAVSPCDVESEDILLAVGSGRAIRFPVDEVREFASRHSTGVRGIRLENGDRVVDMALITHVEATPAELRAYLKAAKAGDEEGADIATTEDEEEGEDGADVTLSDERFAELRDKEQFLLTVTENGYGKRTSAYEYRLTRRGGKGIIAITTSARNGDLAAAFPVTDRDQVMLVTDGGQVIRCPVHDIRIAGRNTQGVTLFRTAEDERVVSVTRLEDAMDEEEEGGEAPADEGVTEEGGEA